MPIDPRNYVPPAGTDEAPLPPPPRAGEYSVLYADPPWRYAWSRSKSRRPDRHYPTMSTAELALLDVRAWAAPDSVLFLWATAPLLREALTLMELWGFRYLTAGTWVKPSIGAGWYFRQRQELLLIGKRGKARPPQPPKNRPDSVLFASRGRHSEKPKEWRRRIEVMYPDAVRLELFARGLPAEGWDAWGLDVDTNKEGTRGG